MYWKKGSPALKAADAVFSCCLLCSCWSYEGVKGIAHLAGF